MRMTVLASGSKGNSAVIASARTRILVDAGLSCRELLRRFVLAGEDPSKLDAILVTHEHQDHVAGLAILARRLGIPVFFTEPTHRAWVRMLTPRTTMTYAKWLEHVQAEKLARAEAALLANGVPTYSPLSNAPGAPSFAASPQRVGSTLSMPPQSPDPQQASSSRPEQRTASSSQQQKLSSRPEQRTASSSPAEWRAPRIAPSPAAAQDPDPTRLLESIAVLSAEAAAFDPALNRSEDPHATLELPGEEDCDPNTPEAKKQDPTFLPAVEYFQAGHKFSIGDLEICPFTIPHDAADPCGFVVESEGIRMAVATDLGYVPPNVKSALKGIDVLLLESNHDLEMLRDGPYPWSVKQRVLSRVGHLSNDATAEFLTRDYDGGATYIVLAHLSESNNAPELARITAERAIGNRMTLLGNRILLALQSAPLEPINL